MKKIDRSAIACFVLFLVVLGGFSACSFFKSESETLLTSGDFTYSLNPDGTITLTKYSGEKMNLEIPASLDELSVSALGEDFFSTLTTITTISVKSATPPALPADALANCTSLTTIYVPDGYYATYIASDFWSAYSSYIVVSEGTITFNANSESAAGSMASLVISGGSISPLTDCGFTLNGYTFTGWARTSDAVAVEYADGANYKMISGSATLHALWTSVSASTYYPGEGTISFLDSSGKAISDNVVSLTQGNTLTVSVKENFRSYQWYLDGDALSGKTEQSLSESTSAWSAGVHAVTLMAVDSSGDEFSDVLSVTLTN